MRTKSTHRMWTTTALAAVTVVTLASCATGDNSSGESSPDSLVVSTSANSGRPGLEKIAPLFTEASGIDVTTKFGQLGNTTYTSELQTQLQGGTAPDVFSAFPGSGTSAPNMGGLASAGSALDLSGTTMAQNLVPELQDAATYDGKTYAAIIGLQFGTVIYNTDLFEQYGLAVPSTFAEYVALVKKIRDTAPDKTPVAVAGSNSAVGLIVASMAAANQDPSDYESTDFADSQAWKAGLQQLADLRDAGAFSPSASTDDTNGIVSQMISGQAFMILDVTSRYSAIKKTDPAAPVAMFPFPAANPLQTRLMIWPGTTLVGNAATANPEGVKKFIDYVMTPENALVWTQAAGGAEFPATDLDNPSAWPEQFAPLAPEADGSVMIPAVGWQSSQIGTALGTDFATLLQNTKSVDEVLADMDAAK